MDKRPEEIPWSLLIVLLLWLPGLLGAARETKTLTMDSRSLCAGDDSRAVHWASKEKTILVIGRGAKDRQLYADCSVVIGVASTQARILQLDFEALHVEDCGVTLIVNQSRRSDFGAATSSCMAKIGCQHGKVRELLSREKHYVKISVHKDDAQLRQYNFRINITVIDKLRETGPEMHVVIIVGVTVVIVVATALWLLVKYLIRRSQRWQEHCAERNMERAIRLYNSQETPPPESDYMYTALPPHDVDFRHSSATHRSSHSHPSKNGGRGGGRHHRAGDITFVHADGHIETFRMRGSLQERRHLGDPPPPSSSSSCEQGPAGVYQQQQQRSSRPASQGRDPDRGESVVEDVAMGECPPSYEEALRMPAMHSFPSSPHYVNLESENRDSHRAI